MSITAIRTVQISSVPTNPSISRHRGNTLVGRVGFQPTRQDAIAAIQAGRYVFYCADIYGNTARVYIVGDPQGDYPQTYANGVWTDNLLAHPRCW